MYWYGWMVCERTGLDWKVIAVAEMTDDVAVVDTDMNWLVVGYVDAPSLKAESLLPVGNADDIAVARCDNDVGDWKCSRMAVQSRCSNFVVEIRLHVSLAAAVSGVGPCQVVWLLAAQSL